MVSRADASSHPVSYITYYSSASVGYRQTTTWKIVFFPESNELHRICGYWYDKLCHKLKSIFTYFVGKRALPSCLAGGDLDGYVVLFFTKSALALSFVAIHTMYV